LKRIILSAMVVALTATMLAVSSLVGNAQEYSGQYASDGQYDSATGQQEGCAWYWDYRFNKNGAWEWWCWSPGLGWWYGESEAGNRKVLAPSATSNGPLQFSI